jgi:hypothetical protein
MEARGAAADRPRTGGGMDPEQFARQLLGMPPAAPGESVRALDGVTAARPRRCVGCGEATDRITFDPETLTLEPARCEPCVDAEWDVQYGLVPPSAPDPARASLPRTCSHPATGSFDV